MFLAFSTADVPALAGVSGGGPSDRAASLAQVHARGAESTRLVRRGREERLSEAVS